MRWVLVVMTSLLAWLSCLTPASAGTRVALIVGNGKYANAALLANPPNDAADIAAMFRKIGFDVVELHDLNREAFVETLGQFSEKSVGADFAVIYYAGHGMEVNNRNYLIPVDARLESDTRLRFETVALDDVLAALDGAKGTRMMLLDACRDNPFLAAMKAKDNSRGWRSGLSEIEAPSGGVIAYAARGGQVALDGLGRNSPFTSAILSNLGKSGIDLQFQLRAVRENVIEQTGGRQEPYISAALPSAPVYLVADEPEMTFTPVLPETGSARDDWTLVKDSKNADVLQAFLQKHGDDAIYSALAKERLAAIDVPKKEASAPSSPAADPAVTRTVDQSRKEQPVTKKTEARKKSQGAEPRAKVRSKQATVQKKTTGNRPSPVGYSYKIWGRATKRDAGKLVKSTPYGVLTCYLSDTESRRGTRNCSWN